DASKDSKVDPTKNPVPNQKTTPKPSPASSISRVHSENAPLTVLMPQSGWHQPYGDKSNKNAASSAGGGAAPSQVQPLSSKALPPAGLGTVPSWAPTALILPTQYSIQTPDSSSEVSRFSFFSTDTNPPLFLSSQ